MERQYYTKTFIQSRLFWMGPLYIPVLAFGFSVVYLDLEFCLQHRILHSGT